jgi:2,4-dienoyl-CoA reductase-like NADH-dependent reductase (Old Yellow Enzyme family)
VLDARVGADDAAVFSDDELDDLVGHFVEAATEAEAAGFSFVDVKHCHGYLGHELLSAVDRPGRYGGDLAGRTNFLRSIVKGIRAQVPDLAIGVRLSAFDIVPFTAGADGVGVPEANGEQHPFGGSASALEPDLDETHQFCDLLAGLGIDLLCVSGGSPYYNPHIQRPAFFPPSDGYQPPEDPLVGVGRLLAAARDLKQRHPALTVVGSGYSYLQEWLPNVAQAAVADGWVDSVGIGRMALSYPTLAADVLAGRSLRRKLICRSFSDCTTAPRNGLVSGCYPLDPFYQARPERVRLSAVKRALRGVDERPAN